MPACTVRIPADHPAFAGHFPGRPIVPGVLLLAEVIEAVVAQRGAAPMQLGTVKFLAPVGPDAELRIEWDEGAGGRLRFEVQQLVGGRAQRCASGHFDL